MTADRVVEQVRAAHRDLGPDRVTDDRVRVAGRLTAVRRLGGLTFAGLRDGTGEVQLVVDTSVLGADAHRGFDACRAGDRVAVEGLVMTTRRGELSVRVAAFEVLAASMVADAGGPSRSRHGGFAATGSRGNEQPGAVDRAAVPPAAPLVVAPTRRGTAHTPVRVLAALTALGGLLQLLALLPAAHQRLAPAAAALGPLWFAVAGHVVSVIVGLLLLQLADQLAKRKHVAWRVALGLFALGAVAHLVKGPHLALVYCLGMVAALVALRDRFRAPPDPPSLLRLARFVPLYLATVLGFGLVSLYVERRAITPAPTWDGALVTVFSGLVGVDGPYVYERRFFAEFFPAALLALGITGLVVFAYLLYRPLAARRPHTEEDWRRAADLVRRHGWDTLAYFTLRDDKSFFFGSDGEAMLAYTYLGGYALVSGDPVGAPESVPRLLDEFLAMCDERAWDPAFLAVRESDVPLYAARGFRALYLGDEAIVRCDRFTLDGAARKGVRSAVRRVGRRYSFRLVAESEAPAALVAQLNAISARWRGSAPERGFTMSLSQDVRGAGANPDFLLCLALDADGRPGGFLRLVPAYGPDFGYTLDLMRRDPDAPNGMTEFLVAGTAAELRERGVARLSMNFAVWGRLFADDVALSSGERLARRLVSLLNPFFQIRSLRTFNAKFDPDWLPRVLAVRHRHDLARVGLLYAGAEGFLALPWVGGLLAPRAVGGVASPSAPPAGGDRVA